MKLNAILGSLSILAVFASGLVSCGPDQKEAAQTFRLPPPQIIQSGERTMDWIEFTQRASPELDDTAYLKLDPQARSPGVRARVRSQCGMTDRVQTHSIWLHQPDKIRVADVIPTESLLKPESKLNCRMDITVTNADGSAHIFPALDFKFQSRVDGSEFTFKQDSVAMTNVTTPPHLPTSEWRRYSIVPRSHTNSLALECEHHRIPIPSHGSDLIFFSEFDIAKAMPRSKVSGGPSRIPEQLCRVVEQTRLGSRGYSPILKIRFPSVRVEAQFTPAKAYLRGRWALLGTSEFKNFEEQPVKIELPGKGTQKIKVLVVGDPAGNSSVFLPIQMRLAGNIDQTTITLPPGGTVRLEVLVFDRVSCQKTRGSTDREYRHLVYFTQQNIGPWFLEERPEGVARGSVIAPWPSGDSFGYAMAGGKLIKPELTNWESMPELKGLCEVRHN